MPSEMISGPDMGGGYLFQLSVDREEARCQFTVHAQDGGMDAGGPPPGPPDVFGFERTPAMCQFGGPQCRHRVFQLPDTETVRVRRAYNRWRFVAAPMLRQTFGAERPPVEQGLTELFDLIAAPLEREGIGWYVGGSAGAWLQGVAVVPADVDLGTSRSGVDRIGELLGEYLIEPVAPTHWPRSGEVVGARAFVGTMKDGLRVEWAVPADPASVRGSQREWAVEPASAGFQVVDWNGRRVPVTRLEYSLVRAAERQRPDRLEAVASTLRGVGLDRRLLESLLADGTLEPDGEAAINAAVVW
jgi:hypothetical protein